jgi:signal transduction histidine kinase
MVAFQSLPTAALLMTVERVVAVNQAYERFMGLPASAVVGRTVLDLIGQFVREGDARLVGAAAEAYRQGLNPQGELWIRVTDAAGRTRPVRVDWRASGNEGESVVYLVDAEGEAAVRAAAEGLARGAGELGVCRDEREVLERAADLLFARGLIVTTLLLRDGDPLLEYGPTRTGGDGNVPLRITASARPRRETLWELNRDFAQRRAAFFQDLTPVVAAYPEGADPALASVTHSRSVQAPLFVNGQPYGALLLSGDDLNPALVGSLEMFAELVARAIENVRLRTELVQRERLAALGEAAAVMAHEVRNPIAAILNAGTLLAKEAIDADARAALVRVIGEEALRLDRLVSDLLDLGRPLTPRRKSVDLHELATRSAQILAARGESTDVVIDVVPPSNAVIASMDPELTQLALWNVLRNAVQASPKGTAVRVLVEARGDLVALIVDDGGPGFPKDKVERILEPFHTTRATGTGIGLAVVRRIVEACRGTIEIDRNPAGGGRFAMVFPSDD